MKIPATAEGVAGHPQADRRGPQHQRHADLRPRPLRRGDRGLPRRASRPTTATSPRVAQRGVVLRQPGRHRGRPAPRGHRHRRGARPAGQGGGRPGPGSPTSCSSRRFTGPRWEALAARGRPRAAAAVGVDVDQEPGLPRHALRRHAHRPRHGQHDARGHARGLRGPRHAGPHRRRRPRRRPRPRSAAIGGRRRRPRRRRPACSRTRASPSSPSPSTSCSRRSTPRRKTCAAVAGTDRRRRTRAPAPREDACTANWWSSTTCPASSPSASSRRSTAARTTRFSLAAVGRRPGPALLRAPGRRRRQPDRLVEGRRLLGRRALRARSTTTSSNYRLAREALLERVGAVNANYPMRCERGPRPLPAAARRARPHRRRPPRPRPRRPHRLAVPGLAGARRRPRPARRHERGPVGPQPPPPHDPHLRRHRPGPAGARHGGGRGQARRAGPGGGAATDVPASHDPGRPGAVARRPGRRRRAWPDAART